MVRKKSRSTVGAYVAAPLAPLAPIERVVDEGAIIYLAAARMAVKNHIIVAALGEHLDYDEDAVSEAARSELERLAAANDETAARLEQASDGSDARDSWLDDRLLRQKREDQRRHPEVLRLIGETLRRHARSAPELQALIEQARADAVEETFRAISARLSAGVVEIDEEYESERAQRISDFVRFDLLGQSTAPTGRLRRRRGVARPR